MHSSEERPCKEAHVRTRRWNMEENLSSMFALSLSPHEMWFSFVQLMQLTLLSYSLSWIELPRPENPANTCMWHTETLDSCFDLIRSHQQCILWSPPLEIQAATTECRAKTLPLSHSPHRTQVMPNQLVMVIAWPINLNVSCKLHLYSLQRTWSSPPKKGKCTSLSFSWQLTKNSSE